MIAKQLIRAAMFGTLVALLATSVAFADNLQSDLNTTTGGLDKTVERGTLSPSTGYTQSRLPLCPGQFGAGTTRRTHSRFPGSGNLGATFGGVTISRPRNR